MNCSRELAEAMLALTEDVLAARPLQFYGRGHREAVAHSATA